MATNVKKRSSRKSGFLVIALSSLTLIFAVCLGVTFLVRKLTLAESDTNNTGSAEQSDIPETPAEPEPEPEPKPVEIDFQSAIDGWVSTTGGNRSVLVYDLDLDKIVGSYNTTESYNTASLYKLFVVYEGYKRVNSGEWDGNAKAGYTGRTILQCLDLAIRESNSECAETIRAMIGWNTLDNIIKNEWGIVNSNIPKLISNANDIMLMMKRFYEHPDFNNEVLLSSMWDSFLNQPPTEYDWRMGMPKGFSRATVYNKVGWDFDPDAEVWNIYHDAAIVKFPLDDGTTRNFVVVVMTNKVDYKNVRRLGTILENEFYQKIKI